MLYGDEYEVLEGRFLRFNSEGITGSRRYRVPGWGNIEEGYYNQYGLPVLGQSWSQYLPYLQVTDISCQEYGTDWAEIAIEYTSDGMYSTEFMSTELAADLTDMGFGPGYEWEGTGQPVIDQYNYAIPAGRYTVTMKQNGINLQAVLGAMNSVNAALWHGFPAETLLFTGATTHTKYSTTGTPTSIDVVYSFEFRRFSHNLQWREPVIKLNEYGQHYYYHNNAAAPSEFTPYYVQPGDPKSFTPVFIGTGAWDKPIRRVTPAGGGAAVTEYLHSPINFTNILDIPDIASTPAPEPSEVTA